jgi:5-methylcytosine-specific restriction endonuclease McrA
MSLRPACSTPRCSGRAAPGSSRCQDCKPLARPLYRKDPALKKIYNSKRWQQVRGIKLQRDPICELQFEGCRQAAVDVHHKVALRDGGKPFDMGSLASACQPCHQKETERERRERKKNGETH